MDLKNEETLRQIIDLVESPENNSRIEKHNRDYEITFGNQAKYIIETLQVKYPESWQTIPVIDLKISNKVVRKLSRCYSNGVIREVIDKKTKEKNIKLTELLNAIYAEVDETNRDFNLIMERFNEYHTNHRYTELFTFIDDETKKIRFRPLPPHLFTAIPNKTKTMAEVIVFKQQVSDFIDVKQHIDWEHVGTDFLDATIAAIYTIWSKEYNFTFVNLRKEFVDEDKKSSVVYRVAVTDYEYNPDGINPIGVFPFCQAKDSTDGHFYPWGSEISHMSKEINVATSDILSIATQQGFGQAVIYYDGDTPPSISKTGPTHVIQIPNKSGNSKFEFANPNPDLTGHLSIATNITRMLLSTNDLTTDKVSGELQATNFASAIDRLIADSETIEYIEGQRKRFIGIEKKQMKIVFAACRYLKETDQWPLEYPTVNLSDLDESKVDLVVHYNSIKPMITDKEKVDTIVKMDEAGLILPWEKHTKFNDQITEKEAIAREELIKQEKLKKAHEMLKQKADQENAMMEMESEDASESDENDQPTQNSGRGQRENQRPQNFNGRRQEENRQYYRRENQREDTRRDRGNSTRPRI